MLAPVSTSLCSERQRAAEHAALANILVVYHSKRGTLRALAQAAADGARAAGATVRLCRIPGPENLLVGGESPATAAESEPTLADLIWADGIVWGTPTYYGNVSAPVKQFIDSTSGLWSLGLLADCVVSGLTSSTSVGGGQESTLLGLYRSMYHWGALVVSTDSSTAGWHEVGGNSYGLSVSACAGAIAAHEHEMAREVGARVARFARRTHALRDQRRGEDCPAPQPNCRLPEAAGRPPARLTVLVQDGPARLEELAGAVAAGGRDAGCEVRLRRLPSLAEAGAGVGPEAASEAGTELPVATAADLAWADGLAWGMSSAHGSLPASVAYFIERSQATLPAADYLNKVVTAFGATANAHCGGESMLLSLYTAMHHWDALIAAPGYTDPVVFAAGGNPYGTLHLDRNGPSLDQVLASARFQGGRLAGLTRWIGGLDSGA